jgi:ATP-dependent Clp protease ATP-binding subunit ClpB
MIPFTLSKLNGVNKIVSSILFKNSGLKCPFRIVTPEGTIPEEVENQVMNILKGHFKPEFLNRIDDS